MFKSLKDLFKPNNKDIRKRLYFTIFALVIYIIGTTIVVPGAETIQANLGYLEYANQITGGALKEFSIFALGVMPYISASIIMQVLQMDVFPYFSELKKQGGTGRAKLNRITRFVGIGFAMVQGYMLAVSFLPETSTALDIVKTTVILTAGTAFLLWLGDQISAKGIGNGISMLIMAGIILTMPGMFVDAFNALVTNGSTQELILGIASFTLFVIVYIGIIIGVIFIQEAERRIPIQYTNKTASSYSSKQTYMPIKVNAAGVIPVVFASVLLVIPGTLASFIGNKGFSLFVENYLNYSTTTGFILYVILIVLFAYLYTFLQLKPEDLSDKLNNENGYIPGIRPGKETTKYIKQVLSRLTIVGSAFLIIIAGLPILFSNISNLPSSIRIGGTGLLIVVGVALETYKQLESRVISRSYTGEYIK